MRIADRPLARLRGFLGRPAPAPGEGMLLTPCNGVHMLGMRYALDVVFVDADGEVVRVCERLAPGAVVPWVRRARAAIELPAGTIHRSNTRVGDVLHFEPAVTS